MIHCLPPMILDCYPCPLNAEFRAFAQAVDVHFVEVSPALRALQWGRLGCRPLQDSSHQHRTTVNSGTISNAEDSKHSNGMGSSRSSIESSKHGNGTGSSGSSRKSSKHGNGMGSSSQSSMSSSSDSSGQQPNEAPSASWFDGAPHQGLSQYSDAQVRGKRV